MDPSEGAEIVSLRSLSLATAVAGDDGFVYRMLREEQAHLLVLSPVQGIVRNLLVIPPGETLSPMYLHYSPGVGLFIQFGERRGARRMDPRSGFISLVHPQTGERSVDHRLTPEIGGILGCHTPRGFLFVQMHHQHPVLFQRAVPRLSFLNPTPRPHGSDQAETKRRLTTDR